MPSAPTNKVLGSRLRVGLAGLTVALALAACGAEEPKTSGTAPAMRRLTEDQFRNSIGDIFGADIKVGGKLEPLLRTDGLVALGARNAAITPSGMENIIQIAQAIAAQVVDEQHRPTFIACDIVDAKVFDEGCASRFFERAGQWLYRRPLTKAEAKARLATAQTATATLGDFYQGLAYSLTGMLVSPNFLYLIDTTEPDPANPEGLRLDGYAKATRLSYFLWNSAPDDALLEAAGRGDLHTGAGLERQVDRMLASVRLENGLRGFFRDALAFEAFDTLEKDSIIYPTFNLSVADDAAEQILLTLQDTLIVRNEDYRNLFTTRRLYMSNALSPVYRVQAPNAEGWAPYEIAEDDQRIGIQSQLGFTALHSHPGRSSPTLRGKAVRELLLCQKIPDPPGDVDFSKFTDPQSPLKTARLRLAAHTEQPACAGCHKLTDPIGLAMEKFDGAGQFRPTEQGEPIDPSGDLDGAKFGDAVGFAKALSTNPAIPSCAVHRLFSYGVGRTPTKDDQAVLTFLQEGFASDGYRYRDLLRRIATSKAFFAVAPRAPRVAAVISSEQSGAP